MASILLVWTRPVSRSCRRIGNISQGRLAIGIAISNGATAAFPKLDNAVEKYHRATFGSLAPLAWFSVMMVAISAIVGASNI